MFVAFPGGEIAAPLLFVAFPGGEIAFSGAEIAAPLAIVAVSVFRRFARVSRQRRALGFDSRRDSRRTPVSPVDVQILKKRSDARARRPTEATQLIEFARKSRKLSNFSLSRGRLDSAQISAKSRILPHFR